MTGLSVSAVVCAFSRQRWGDTVAAVESLAAQDPAPRELVLVIDHNPTLAARARRHFAGGPCSVLENGFARGLSGARNTALRHVSAEVVVFLDDDAAARPGWLAALLEHYRDPEVVAVGGRAEARWPAGRAPSWFPAELHWVVGCSYAGQHDGDRSGEVRNLMGCAMSFRREAFDAVGGFAESMGRIGSTPLGGEETDLCIRLRQARPSARIVFEPRAVVDHRVTPARTRPTYLVRRAWAEGRSKAVLTQRVGAGDGLAAERRYTRVVLPAALRRELGAGAGALARGRIASAAGSIGAAVAVVATVVAAAAGLVRGRIASRPGETTLKQTALLNRRVAGGLLAVTGVIACALAALDATGGAAKDVRTVATVLFLLLGPGWAIAGFLRRVSPSLLWALTLAVGAAVGAVGGQAMVLLGLWSPVIALYVVAALCVPVLVRHAAATR